MLIYIRPQGKSPCGGDFLCHDYLSPSYEFLILKISLFRILLIHRFSKRPSKTPQNQGKIAVLNRICTKPTIFYSINIFVSVKIVDFAIIPIWLIRVFLFSRYFLEHYQYLLLFFTYNAAEWFYCHSAIFSVYFTAVLRLVEILMLSAFAQLCNF